MTGQKPVTYRAVDDDSSYRRSARRVTLEGQRVDEDGNPIESSAGWTAHPGQRSPRRLQPFGLRDDIDDLDERGRMLADRYGEQSGTNVTVNNNGSFYRPLREELLLSGWRTFGNFLAWPFRLVGRFIENLLNAAAGVLKMMLLAVVMPSLLFAGIAFYQSHRDSSATEIASEIGAASVHIVAAAAKGVWRGIFGSDEEPAKPAPSESGADRGPQPDRAPPERTKR